MYKCFMMIFTGKMKVCIRHFRFQEGKQLQAVIETIEMVPFFCTVPHVNARSLKGVVIHAGIR